MLSSLLASVPHICPGIESHLPIVLFTCQSPASRLGQVPALDVRASQKLCLPSGSSFYCGPCSSEGETQIQSYLTKGTSALEAGRKRKGRREMERERLFCHGVLRERKGPRFPACPLIDHRREERHAEGVRSQVGVAGGATG